jgi:hypothetical protein
MKRSHLYRMVGAGTITLSLAIVSSALPASAQTTPENRNLDRSCQSANTTSWQFGNYNVNNSDLLGGVALLSLGLLVGAYNRSDRY